MSLFIPCVILRYSGSVTLPMDWHINDPEIASSDNLSAEARQERTFPIEYLNQYLIIHMSVSQYNLSITANSFIAIIYVTCVLYIFDNVKVITETVKK